MSPPGPPTLGYCLNVHPGETLDEVTAALEGPVARVARLEAAARPGAGALPVGLYLAARAAREVVRSPAAFERLRGALASAGARVFTANAFPAGGFHGEALKRAVYRPTWSDPARLAYTLDVAHVLARLLPGESASLSTVPVSYSLFEPPEPALERAGDHLGAGALALEALERETGCSLAVALEPEPLATCETARSLVAFLEAHVFSGAGRARCVRESGLAPERAEAILRARVGACLDACHEAVVFEPIETALATYARAGVRVVKAQLSSAVEVAPRAHPEGARRLRAFAEPRYLHQTFWSRDGAVGHVEDLPLAFEGERLRAELEGADLVRSHVHVPLAWAGDGGVATTRDELARALPALARATSSLEVETYTFTVLPEETRARFGGDVARMVAAELEWARASLARA